MPDALRCFSLLRISGWNTCAVLVVSQFVQKQLSLCAVSVPSHFLLMVSFGEWWALVNGEPWWMVSCNIWGRASRADFLPPCSLWVVKEAGYGGALSSLALWLDLRCLQHSSLAVFLSFHPPQLHSRQTKPNENEHFQKDSKQGNWWVSFIHSFIFGFLRQGFSVQSWLSWNLLCRSGWPQLRDPPAPASQVLGKACATTFGNWWISNFQI